MADSIIVKHLSIRTVIGVDAWERAKLQPVLVTATLATDIAKVGATDLLANTINYGTVAKDITALAEANAHVSLEALANAIAAHILTKNPPAVKITVKLEKPKALLHAKTSGVEVTRTRKYLEYLREKEKENEGGRVKNEGDASMTTAAASMNPDSRRVDFSEDTRYLIHVADLKTSTIIGVNPWERLDKQIVALNLTIYHDSDGCFDKVPHNYRTMVRTITEYVEASDFKTVEAFVTAVARLAIVECNVPKITVKVEKPSALAFAASAGVEITRDRRFFETALEDRLESDRTGREGPAMRHSHPPSNAGFSTSRSKKVASASASRVKEAASVSPMHVAYVALGSNLGDDLPWNLSQALRHLEDAGCAVVDTSFLYQTAPMYVTDQPMFMNAACKITTDKSPQDLLACLKRIEDEMGRVATIRNGPRVIDLDIIFYDDIVLDTEHLVIPHPRLPEREFVLRPLCDMAPNHEHPSRFRTIQHLLNQLMAPPLASPTSVQKVLPIGRTTTSSSSSDAKAPASASSAAATWRWGERTFLMGVLNVTPDSFSDGGLYHSLPSALSRAEELIDAGADILDVGGQSTRPDAEEISAQEEISRVVPVIRALRTQSPTGSRTRDIPISIDTFRASVARAALDAGADLVNDVSGGTRDPQMLATMAAAGVPVCLMHMSGDSKTMATLTDYGDDGGDDDVVGHVRRTLAKRVADALAAGVRRWNIILDPGLGFAKTTEQSYDVVRKLPALFRRSALETTKAQHHHHHHHHQQQQTRTGSAASMLSRNTPPSPSPSPSTDSFSLLLKETDVLVGFPCLVGPSRKAFVGKALRKLDDASGAEKNEVERPANDRVWGTAAACTALVANGADILRVHDVKEMKDVVAVADAIWRR